jgi:hypothetical protein
VWIPVVIGFFVGGGCYQSEQPSPKSGPEEAVKSRGEKPSDYHFHLKYEDMWGVTTLMINGFPVHQSGGGHITNNPVLEIELNTGLVGEGNEVTLQVEPMLLGEGKAGLDIGSARVHGHVTRDHHGKFKVKGAKITETQVDSAYQAWSERARSKYGDYRSQNAGSALDSIRAWAERNPLTVTTTFDNEAGPDFSRIFEEAPVLEDTPATRERLKEYAMRLRDLMAEKDTLGLFHEARPLFTDHDTGTPYKKGRVLKIISSNWFGQNWQLQLRRDQLGVRRWAEGRVWELYRRESGDELFMEGTEGASVLDIYVAEIDGQLTVVR